MLPKPTTMSQRVVLPLVCRFPRWPLLSSSCWSLVYCVMYVLRSRTSEKEESKKREV
jgi:hypothetical protein